MTQGTHQIASACAASASQSGEITVTLKCADQTRLEDVLAAQGFIFATPEYLASMSGLMKDFFDRTYYGALSKIEGQPYATMICAGSDGHSAASQIERIATGWRLKRIQPPIIINVGATTAESIMSLKRLGCDQLEPCRTLGTLFATGLAMGIF